ncbi:leucyl/phenylalanyl-tRNA--protein transferase [Dongia sp.]|uniref:leucyl/phenylalanyl-tRNA--protein transferase n=1 Tax=Dongia sp. TaxID=1977262 RepID=UPI0035B0A480
MSNRIKQPKITPEMLLRAYAIGIFPMAEARNDPELYWIDPELRGILPLDDFHIPHSLKKTVRHCLAGKAPGYRVTCDTAFDAIVQGCATPAPGRHQTWINDTIFDLCRQLFVMGHAHSVEVWQDEQLVGGLYGISLGGAFFGESMFSRATDASKVALVHLVARLRQGGFKLLDTQFVTKHLSRFGTIEIPREAYRERLNAALAQPAVFYGVVPDSVVLELLGSDVAGSESGAD